MSNFDVHTRKSETGTGVPHHSLVLRYLAVCVAAALVVGTVAFTVQRPRIARKIELRIGINPWPGYEFAYLARERGFLADEGLDVRLIEFSSLGDTRRAYERGQIDGFFGSVVELIQSHAQGARHPQAALVTDYSHGADVIVGQQNVHNVVDLRGKKVGVEVSSLNGFILARALEAASMTLDDVTIVPTEQLHMERILESGEVDAVVTYPPVSVNLLKKNLNVIFSTSVIPGEVLDLLIIDREILRAQPTISERFARAFWRAQDHASSNPDEVYAQLGKREGISGEAFRQTLIDGVELVGREMHGDFIGPRGRLDQNIDAVGRVLYLTHQIPTAPPDGKSLVVGAKE